jgi:hypothetical protein
MRGHVVPRAQHHRPPVIGPQFVEHPLGPSRGVAKYHDMVTDVHLDVPLHPLPPRPFDSGHQLREERGQRGDSAYHYVAADEVTRGRHRVEVPVAYG